VKQTGRVKQWFADRGFGFIMPTGLNSGDEDVFVHVSDLHREKLNVGEHVSYDMKHNRSTGKWRAVNIVGDHSTSETGTGSLWIATRNLIVRDSFSTVHSRYVDTIEKGIQVEVVEFKSNSLAHHKSAAVRVRIVSPIEGWTDLKFWSRTNKKMVDCLEKTASRGSALAPIQIRAKRTRTKTSKQNGYHFNHVGYVAPEPEKLENEVSVQAFKRFIVKNVPKNASSVLVKRDLSYAGIYAVEVRIVDTANSTNQAEISFCTQNLANVGEKMMKRNSVKVGKNHLKFVKHLN